jgi:hypothetical protein
MTRNLILAFDPGETTGMALYALGTRELLVTDALPSYEAVVAMWTLIHQHGDDLEVTYEKFIISPRTLRSSQQTDALQVTGAIRFRCEMSAIPFTSYTPADSKNFSTDEKLARMGLIRPGPDHIRDATRILALHLARKHSTVFKELYAAR